MRDPEDYGIIIIDNNYNTAGINPDKGVHEKKMSMTLHKEGKKFKDLSKPQSEINTVRKTQEIDLMPAPHCDIPFPPVMGAEENIDMGSNLVNPRNSVIEHEEDELNEDSIGHEYIESLANKSDKYDMNIENSEPELP